MRVNFSNGCHCMIKWCLTHHVRRISGGHDSENLTDRRRDPDISVVRGAPRNNPILATTRNPRNAGLRHRQPQQETIMATTIAKGALHRRAVHELKEFVLLFTYLYITIGAVVLLKAAVLHAQGIDS